MEICLGMAAGPVAAAFWGFMMVTVVCVRYIRPYKTFGKNVASNCLRKLALAQSSSQAGSTTSPKSKTKLFWLMNKFATKILPAAKDRNKPT
jgi:hypothetical protein